MQFTYSCLEIGRHKDLLANSSFVWSDSNAIMRTCNATIKNLFARNLGSQGRIIKNKASKMS